MAPSELTADERQRLAAELDKLEARLDRLGERGAPLEKLLDKDAQE